MRASRRADDARANGCGSLHQAFEETGSFSYRTRLFHGAADDEAMRFVARFDPGDNCWIVEYELAFGQANVDHWRFDERLTARSGETILYARRWWS